MAPIVAPGICRFTVNGAIGGRPTANIFDMLIDTFGGGLSRSAAISHQAGDILNAFSDRILPLTTTDFTADSVTWVDLDTLDGETGIATTGADETWPQAGTVATDAYPGNTSVLITKVAPGGGRAFRNGRTYWVGAPQTTDEPGTVGTLTAGNVAAYSAAWDGFSSDISNGLTDGYDSNMVVVHTRNIADEGDPPNIVFISASSVTQMVCQARLATQRRRLRG